MRTSTNFTNFERYIAQNSANQGRNQRKSVPCRKSALSLLIVEHHLLNHRLRIAIQVFYVGGVLRLQLVPSNLLVAFKNTHPPFAPLELRQLHVKYTIVDPPVGFVHAMWLHKLSLHQELVSGASFKSHLAFLRSKLNVQVSRLNSARKLQCNVNFERSLSPAVRLAFKRQKEELLKVRKNVIVIVRFFQLQINRTLVGLQAIGIPVLFHLGR